MKQYFDEKVVLASPEVVATKWRRWNAGELVRAGWHLDRRLAFATEAIVSSRPGTPRRPGVERPCRELVGPPAVFPYCADDAGAWRSHPEDPRPRATLRFGVDAPAVAIRIFETWRPGAVVAVDTELDGGRTLALHRADAARLREPEAVAVVLEVALPEPATVRAVTLTLDPTVAGPVAVDAVALVLASEASPPGTDWTRSRRQRSLRWTIGTHVAGLALVGGLLASAWPSGDPLPANDRSVPTAATVAPLAAIEAAHGALRWTDTADEEASTPSAVPGYGPRFAAGAPDAPRPPLDAPERTWSPPADAAYHRELAVLALDVSPPCEARGIVIVESVGSGALRGVDVGATPTDLIRVFEAGQGSGPEEPGGPRTPPAGAIRAGLGEAVVLNFRAPLNVGRVRLSFDPRAIPGTVSVDAVGIIPATRGGCATDAAPVRAMRTNDFPTGSGGSPGTP